MILDRVMDELIAQEIKEIYDSDQVQQILIFVQKFCADFLK